MLNQNEIAAQYFIFKLKITDNQYQPFLKYFVFLANSKKYSSK